MAISNTFPLPFQQVLKSILNHFHTYFYYYSFAFLATFDGNFDTFLKKILLIFIAILPTFDNHFDTFLLIFQLLFDCPFDNFS